MLHKKKCHKEAKKGDEGNKPTAQAMHFVISSSSQMNLLFMPSCVAATGKQKSPNEILFHNFHYQLCCSN